MKKVISRGLDSFIDNMCFIMSILYFIIAAELFDTLDFTFFHLLIACFFIFLCLLIDAALNSAVEKKYARVLHKALPLLGLIALYPMGNYGALCLLFSVGYVISSPLKQAGSVYIKTLIGFLPILFLYLLVVSHTIDMHWGITEHLMILAHYLICIYLIASYDGKPIVFAFIHAAALFAMLLALLQHNGVIFFFPFALFSPFWVVVLTAANLLGMSIFLTIEMRDGPLPDDMFLEKENI